MKIDDLKAACELAISNGRDYIILVNRTLRLCGRHGPNGELLNETRGGKTVRYKAQAILDFIKREQK